MSSEVNVGSESRSLKKLRLFLSTGNPLWKDLTRLDSATKGVLAAQRKSGSKKLPIRKRGTEQGTEYFVTTCLRMLGISGEWRRRHLAGHIPDPERLRRRIEDLLRRLERVTADMRPGVGLPHDEHVLALNLRDRLQGFLDSYSDPRSNVYVAAAALGLDVDACQKELDGIFFNRPFITGLFFEDSAHGKAMAEEALQQLRGYYRAYLRRTVTSGSGEGETIFLGCTLRVRYLLRLEGGYGIRVKLNLPLIDPSPHQVETARALHGEPPIIEYDGFVVPREKCYWVMIQRTLLPDGDVISLITSGAHDGRADMRGRYLTLGQDAAKSIVDDEVVLQRIPDEEVGKVDAQTRGSITRSAVRTLRQGDKAFEAVARMFPLLVNAPRAAPGRSGTRR